MIQYEDGKKKLNDLQRIPYMIRRLPEWRRDVTTYDDIDKSAVEPINPKKVAGEKQQEETKAVNNSDDLKWNNTTTTTATTNATKKQAPPGMSDEDEDENVSFNVEGSSGTDSDSDSDGLPPPANDVLISGEQKIQTQQMAPPEDPPPPTGVKALIGLRASGQSTSSTVSSTTISSSTTTSSTSSTTTSSTTASTTASTAASTTASSAPTTSANRAQRRPSMLEGGSDSDGEIGTFNVEGSSGTDSDEDEDEVTAAPATFICQENAFQLLWDKRDIGTTISVQSSKEEDQYQAYVGKIVGWNGKSHMLVFEHDNKKREYDLRPMNFDLISLPNNRLSPNGSDIHAQPQEDWPNSKKHPHCRMKFQNEQKLNKHILEHTPHNIALKKHRNSIIAMGNESTPSKPAKHLHKRTPSSLAMIQQEHDRQMNA